MKAPKSIIQRITASNGSVFTGPGTNSYLIGTDDITLVDPGPKIDAHLSNLLELGKNKIKRIYEPDCPLIPSNILKALINNKKHSIEKIKENSLILKFLLNKLILINSIFKFGSRSIVKNIINI